MYFDQQEFDVRFEWGLAGIEALAPVSDVIVIVDVLSFSPRSTSRWAMGPSCTPIGARPMNSPRLRLRSTPRRSTRGGTGPWLHAGALFADVDPQRHAARAPFAQRVNPLPVHGRPADAGGLSANAAAVAAGCPTGPAHQRHRRGRAVARTAPAAGAGRSAWGGRDHRAPRRQPVARSRHGRGRFPPRRTKFGRDVAALRLGQGIGGARFRGGRSHCVSAECERRCAPVDGRRVSGGDGGLIKWGALAHLSLVCYIVAKPDNTVSLSYC